MSVVFLDTSGMVALWNRSDQWHPHATEAFERIVRDRVRMVTTTYVMLECANDAARRPYRHEVAAFHRGLISRGDLVVPSESEYRQAWLTYGSDDPGGPSVVDLISFLVMRRLKIEEAFAHDRHFRLGGFAPLF